MVLTAEQERVIKDRGHNLLVSAGAGAGKTAVLVSRIVGRITSKDEKCDVDRFLVMTFTRAAADEMKSRIRDRLESLLQEALESGDTEMAAHLRTQLGLIRGAYISTIDGFCTNVLRNNFNVIGLDPSFRVAGNAELTLLKKEVMDELLESEYEAGERTFTEFIEAFSNRNSDKNVAEMIENLYEYSRSKPDPFGWLDKCLSLYTVEGAGELFDIPVVKAFYESARHRLESALSYCDEAADMSVSPGGPQAYHDLLEEEGRMIDEVICAIKDGESYDRIRNRLKSIEFKRLPQARSKDLVDPEVKDNVKALRDTYKKKLGAVLSECYFTSEQTLLEDVQHCAGHVATLTELTKKYSIALAEAKKERRIVDFADLEHFTLDVLYEPGENGRRSSIPSETASQYRDYFHEIYVDEYQDSNEVQEEILRAIAREDDKSGNLFMVGDVKQSIYRFRLATPKLFTEKDNSYYHIGCYDDSDQEEPFKNGKINLSRNFRSRSEVIKITNYFFSSLMKKEVGNVEYDSDARLIYGGLYGEEDEEASDTEHIPELLLVDEDEQVSPGEMEGTAIAMRIEELMRDFRVFDIGSQAYRPLKYSDIAILVRAVGDRELEIKKTLVDRGIPVFSEDRAGYFSGYEIRTLLDMLTVIDNPRNDEALCAVLKGYFGGLSDEELSGIRIAFNEGNFYIAAMRYAGFEEEADPLRLTAGAGQAAGKVQEQSSGEDPEISFGDGQEQGGAKCRDFEGKMQETDPDLQEKLQNILRMIWDYTEKSRYMTVKELISLLIEEKGFATSVRAMEKGDIRRQNLDMLAVRAAEYEQSSYRGLFNFVKYIEELKFYEEDFGQAQNISESDDVVRMMTIHKSKGLEFPVCFLPRLAKKFNKTDVTGNLVMDAENGIGMNYIDVENRTKTTTVIKKSLANEIEREGLGEELRVLYVAMTRAKEKLIMSTALNKTIKKKIQMHNRVQKIGVDRLGLEKENPELNFAEIEECGSYLEWMLEVLCSDSRLNRPLKSMTGENPTENQVNIGGIPLRIKLINSESLVIQQLDTCVTQNELKAAFREVLKKTGEIDDFESLDLKNGEKSAGDYESRFGDRDNEDGCFGNGRYIPVKVSVSKLKHGDADIGGVYEPVRGYEDYVNRTNDNAEVDNMSDAIEEADKREEGTIHNDRNKTPVSERPVPDFIKRKRGEDVSDAPLIGSLRGSAYHRFFELLNYNQNLKEAGIREQIAEFRDRGFLDEKQAEVLRAKDFSVFASSSIGKRMKSAALKGLLKREQPFCIAVTADTIDPEYPGSEYILVQGIIDALFSEEGEDGSQYYVIVDYKTDNVRFLSQLEEMYSSQLYHYARAVEQITGIPVRECVIYSVKLGKEVSLSGERDDG